MSCRWTSGSDESLSLLSPATIRVRSRMPSLEDEKFEELMAITRMMKKVFGASPDMVADDSDGGSSPTMRRLN